MQTKKFLASLLAFLMLFSLVPAFGLAAGAEGEGRITPVVDETEPEAEPEADLPEAEPEAAPEADEPNADPVVYDLWVCGVQVTDANKDTIKPGMKYDPATSTLSFTGAASSTLKNNPGLYNGAVIYSELPELTLTTNATLTVNSDEAQYLFYAKGGDLILAESSDAFQTLSSTSATSCIYVEDGDLTVNCYLKLNASAAQYGIYVKNGTLLLDNNRGKNPVVLFSSMQNAVGIDNGTIYGNPNMATSIVYTEPNKREAFSSPTLRGNSVTNAMIVSNSDELVFDGKMRISSASAAYGVYVPNGDVTNQADLNVALDEVADGCCIYAGKGLSSSGPLNVSNYEGDDGYGIKVMNGPVDITCDVVYLFARHCGLYCASGDVNISGTASIMIGIAGAADDLCPSSGIYANDGSVTIGAIGMGGGASYAVFANGPVHVTCDVAFENTANLLGGAGIKSTTGGIVIDGNADITATVCLDSGDSTEGILIKGDATLKPTGRHGAIASNGPITVQGNLDARDAMHCAVIAKGDIRVEGDAYITASDHGYDDLPGVPMQSTDGSIIVEGDLTCSGTKNPAYAKNDIRVGGNALFSGSGDYGVKAENGEITIGGTMTCKGQPAVSAYAGTSITVEKDVTVSNTAEDSIGMYAVGFINVVSGKWDVSAGAAALQAGNGIEIPETHSVVLPIGGAVSLVDSLHTITEADGTTVAAHTIIDSAEYVTVTFDLNYTGSEPITVQVVKGGTLDELPTAERATSATAVWKLLGWYDEAASGINVGTGNQITTETVFTEDTTVYAHWRLPGDVNGDGLVNGADLVLLAEYIKARGVDVNVVPGSVNIDGSEDGRVNGLDLIRLAEYIKARGVGVEIN